MRKGRKWEMLLAMKFQNPEKSRKVLERVINSIKKRVSLSENLDQIIRDKELLETFLEISEQLPLPAVIRVNVKTGELIE